MRWEAGMGLLISSDTKLKIDPGCPKRGAFLKPNFLNLGPGALLLARHKILHTTINFETVSIVG
jgi:hypothetical protein